MNVLSLFDGMSCGQIALERAGIPVDTYYASEIDKYAMQVTQKNYPNTVQLGDITQLEDWELPDVDIIIGGSPCQGFSLAGKLKGSSTKCGIDVTSLEQYLQLKKDDFEFEGQSYLFWEYMRILRVVKPKYFFLENVRVTKKWLPMFNEAMGVEGVLINSALVSAQNRVRYYWTNIPNVTQPEDRGIMLKDILESGVSTDEMTSGGKSYCVTARYSGAVAWNYIERKQRTMVALERPCELREFKEESVCHHTATAIDISGNDSIKRVYKDTGKSPALTTMQGGHRQPKILCGASRGRYLVDGIRHQDGKMLTAGNTEQMMGVRPDEKTNCLTTVQKDNYVVTGLEHSDRVPMGSVRVGTVNNGSQGDRVYSSEGKSSTLSAQSGATAGAGNMLLDEYPTYRKLTPVECARLQTIPDLYCSSVSNSQQYKMLGNGWTVDVIAHIFRGLK